MRVLVAGAAGLIGSAVALEFADHGHDVVRLVRREPGPGEVRWDSALRHQLGALA
jgi:nucleoside-diphosphate-sugar epimerase